MKLHQNVPWVILLYTKVGEIILVRWAKGVLRMHISNSSCLKLLAQGFHIWYIILCRGPIQRLLNLCPQVQN